MTLNKGEIIGFVGANGSGKTVLLKMICGFIKPDKGEILWEQKQIGKTIDFPAETGIMIDEPGFFQAYSARQNLRLLAAHKNKLTKEQIDEAISMVGLDPNNRKPVGKYSMGMRQRLCFAQAIMENPKLLILDEPFNSLDKEWASWMKERIKQYHSSEKLIIITSHRQEDIDYLCSRTYIFENGDVTESK